VAAGVGVATAGVVAAGAAGAEVVAAGVAGGGGVTLRAAVTFAVGVDTRIRTAGTAGPVFAALE
jgi:hypothetical protein